jgi:hypothetical protein
MNREYDNGSFEKPMMWSYGYINDTVAKDGDEHDVIVGHHVFADGSTNSFVVKQLNQYGELDEYKIMHGFPTQNIARQAYFDFYGDVASRLYGGISSAMTNADIKLWIDLDGDGDGDVDYETDYNVSESFKVGGEWKSRDGDVFTITEIKPKGLYPISAKSDNGDEMTFTKDGKHDISNDSTYDLIKMVSESFDDDAPKSERFYNHDEDYIDISEPSELSKSETLLFSSKIKEALIENDSITLVSTRLNKTFKIDIDELIWDTPSLSKHKIFNFDRKFASENSFKDYIAKAPKAKALIDDFVSYIVDKVFNLAESKQCDKFKIK